MTIPTIICLVVSILSTLFFQNLSKTERLILIVLYLNLIADIVGPHLEKDANGYLYNIITPIEKIITLILYAAVSTTRKHKIFNLTGIVVIIVLSILGYFVRFSAETFHFEVYVVSGFVISILSYLFLRKLALRKEQFSTVILLFGMANLVYYTVMVSAVSAMPIARKHSSVFASDLFTINDIAYSLWSLTILTGILWKRVTKT